jgi:3D-(3,5/4)-trihydroxycyclohexane-1,2-dione acylhydrolase (decyclizing)
MAAGGLDAALSSKALAETVDVSVSEAVVLGLLKQNVTKFFGILGHGNTDIGEILRIYSVAGALRFFHCRNEVAMAHAATAAAWIYGETPAVLTSIGPGALQAYAGSLAAASNGVGVYHLYGDETTHGEGYNMQGVIGRRQNQFGRLTDILGRSYTLHTPEALRDAMRQGTATVHRRGMAGPFYLCLPINVQPRVVQGLNLAALPQRIDEPAMMPADEHDIYAKACALTARHRRIVIKAGGGTRTNPDAIRRLAERIGAAVVLSPNSVGVLPDTHPLNMHVGGSKGSISGNFAMENATLLIAIGTRAVCQADCSGTGYPNVEAVININTSFDDAAHYNRTLMLPGDASAVIDKWLGKLGPLNPQDAARSGWLAELAAKKREWHDLRETRCAADAVQDDAWNRPVLTQPAAIAIADRFARSIDAIKIFDAGDVQANGFQIVADNAPGETFTEAGASYMGFAVSALLAAAVTSKPKYMIAFTGDGSFMMNPQILVDAVVHRIKGMIILFDNRRMGAISSLQSAQYGIDFGTNDGVEIDFVAFAKSVSGVHAEFGGYSAAEFEAALRRAAAFDGLSLVHIPVYWGHDPMGGMGAYGRWNVGPWCADVERRYAEQTL